MSVSMSKARSLTNRFARQRILVVGDLMLDRYVYGTVSRISPEAPVPVVEVQRQTAMPGGASNVALNIRALGGGASVAGVAGRDVDGRELRRVMMSDGVNVGGMLMLAGRQTTAKTRVIAERQQVVRVDFEGRTRLDRKHKEAFCRQLRKAVARSTGVVIEDYGKGLIDRDILNAVLEPARAARIPVGMDPKDDHEFSLAAITVVTPNRKEAFTLAGVADPGATPNPLEDKPLIEVGQTLLGKWSPEFLLITLGPMGMLLLMARGEAHHVPTRAREVFDVSGAGDTVIATCVLALAAGAKPIEAAELANCAAGVVVGKLGTATCTVPELMGYLPK